jgi:hypothetical protein
MSRMSVVLPDSVRPSKTLKEPGSSVKLTSSIQVSPSTTRDTFCSVSDIVSTFFVVIVFICGPVFGFLWLKSEHTL